MYISWFKICRVNTLVRIDSCDFISFKFYFWFRIEFYLIKKNNDKYNSKQTFLFISMDFSVWIFLSHFFVRLCNFSLRILWFISFVLHLNSLIGNTTLFWCNFWIEPNCSRQLWVVATENFSVRNLCKLRYTTYIYQLKTIGICRIGF